MKRFIVRHKILSGLVAVPLTLISALVVLEYGGGPVGYLQAKWDLSRGNYRIKAVGMRSLDSPQYEELLRERYNVNVDTVAGCTPSPWEWAYSKAYDTLAERAIQERFHKNVFDECYNDAIQTYLQAHPSEIKKDE